MTSAEVIAEAILTREWWDHEKAAHNFHLHDSGCAVCMGWVPAMVDEGLRGLDLAGMVVVSAEDLNTIAEHLAEAIEELKPEHAYLRERADRKGYSHDEAAAEVYEKAIPVVTEALARLRAALPERTETDG